MRRLWMLTLLTACATGADDPATWGAAPEADDAFAAPPVSVAPPPGVLDLSTETWQAGFPTTMTVRGAGPGDTVFFLLSPQPGSTPACPGAIAPDCLDIGNPIVLGNDVADANGVATFTLNVPTPAPVPEVELQAAVALGVGADTSNVLLHPLVTYSWAHDIDPLFQTECAGCHTGGGTSGGMSLDDPADVIDFPSNDVPTMDRIEPGDPANSYIWHKLNDTQLTVGGAGVSMPRFQPLLPQADRDMIETWILEGAPL